MFFIDKQSFCNGFPLQPYRLILKIHFIKDKAKHDKHKETEHKSVFFKMHFQLILKKYDLHNQKNEIVFIITLM